MFNAAENTSNAVSGRLVFATSGKAEMLWLIPMFAMFACITIIAEILSYFNGTSAVSMVVSYGWKALRLMPAVVFVGLMVQIAMAVKNDASTAADTVILQWRQIISDPYMLAARVSPIILMPFFFSSFSVLKMLMPRYIPFWLDEPFAKIDKFLFFGHQPWELTHAVFSSVFATQLIDLFYSIWVLLLSIAIVGFALFAPRLERARFFLSFGGAWVFLGFVGAWIGASAGPCFAELLGMPSAPEFAGMMKNLWYADAATGGNINAPGWQQMLWNGYTSETYSFGMGISAMPSLHNAIAVLYVFMAFRIGKLIGWFMTGYAVIIFVGSIHLGWHYAVDGIIAALSMWLIWRVVNWWCVASGYDASVTREALAAVTATIRP